MNKLSSQARKLRRAGFTLIEILLVVVIIGMLAGLAAVGIPRYLRTAKENTARADISSIETAVKSFTMSNKGKHPANLGALTEGDQPYMDKLPNDPWGNPYQYAFPSTHRRSRDAFDVSSMGDDGVPSEDDITNWETDSDKSK